MRNSYALLNGHIKATKIANILEPLLIKQAIPISLLADMRAAEWWAEVARMAGAKPPSDETKAEVTKILYARAEARRRANDTTD